MHWTKLEERWRARGAMVPGDELEAGVIFALRDWTVPGEPPLEVRACARRGFPLESYSRGWELAPSAIVLHESLAHASFSGLMGGHEPAHPSQRSAHFLVGRDGNAYQLVPIDRVAWHAGEWSPRSIGVVIDNLGALREEEGGEQLYGPHGPPDVYCARGERGCYEIETFRGVRCWSTWTARQYEGAARLLKALAWRTGIPLVIQDAQSRLEPLTRLPLALQQRFRGVTTSLQVLPDAPPGLGPALDWARLIARAGLLEGDCFRAPAPAQQESGA